MLSFRVFIMSSYLWKPSQNRCDQSSVSRFAQTLADQGLVDWQGDFHALWQWSADHPDIFWDQFWDWHGLIGDKGEVICKNPDQMTGGQFYPDGILNYAENLLVDADDSPAIIAWRENGERQAITRAELKQRVMAMAGWLKSQGVGKGDRVAAYIPNIPEAVILLLASSAIGAVFSSCSTDFGLNGVLDRFGQIKPKVLMVVDGYRYNGKAIDRRDINRQLRAEMPSVVASLIVPFLDPDMKPDDKETRFDDALAMATPVDHFEPTAFNDPLYILYSSGTTGAPKCIVHGGGGSLIQHIKEHRLHSDHGTGDTVFYFTTCGWMMWNWLVSALAVKAAIVLYEGNPFYPGPERLWQMAADERLNTFGTSAKFIDATRKSGYRPCDNVDLTHLQRICSTGSPLTEDGFDFVYDAIKSDLHLASISGGTDLVSCFVLGAPSLPVYKGEIQTRGLGMAVAVWDENGQPVIDQQGELVCTRPFPSMPIGFWNDPDDEKYRAAYFDHFPGIWRHGDWATLTSRHGVVIHGRSDATLNPGGVRIGTAEIYRQVEAFDDIHEALVVGQNIIHDGQQDMRVILFVRLADKVTLNDDLKKTLSRAIREGATPRHVPYAIIAVPDIPRTRSGKITELAVRDIIHGKEIKNTEALANPEALEYFRNLEQLHESD
jgi:acetoacetyl-CoA synthetase